MSFLEYERKKENSLNHFYEYFSPDRTNEIKIFHLSCVREIVESRDLIWSPEIKLLMIMTHCEFESSLAKELNFKLLKDFENLLSPAEHEKHFNEMKFSGI